MTKQTNITSRPTSLSPLAKGTLHFTVMVTVRGVFLVAMLGELFCLYLLTKYPEFLYQAQYLAMNKSVNQLIHAPQTTVNQGKYLVMNKPVDQLLLAPHTAVESAIVNSTLHQVYRLPAMIQQKGTVPQKGKGNATAK